MPAFADTLSIDANASFDTVARRQSLPAADRVRLSLGKTGAAAGFLAALTAFGLSHLTDHGRFEAGALLPLILLLPMLAYWSMRMKDAIKVRWVIDECGVSDLAMAARLEWDRIDRIELREVAMPASQYALVFVPKDPRALAQAKRPPLTFGPLQVRIPLSYLPGRWQEFVPRVEEYSGMPITKVTSKSAQSSPSDH